MFTYLSRLSPLGRCVGEEEDTINNNINNSINNITINITDMTPFNISSMVSSCEEGLELEVVTDLGLCYLHHMDKPSQKIRIFVELLIVLMAFCFLVKAVREFKFLGRAIFVQNMKLCPSRVFFLLSCILHQVTVPARLLCLHVLDDALVQLCMLANGCYFLFFCRGFKLVGPMVIMIYRSAGGSAAVQLYLDKCQNVGPGPHEIWNDLLHIPDGLRAGLLPHFHELRQRGGRQSNADCHGQRPPGLQTPHHPLVLL